MNMEGLGGECDQEHDVKFPKNQKKYYFQKQGEGGGREEEEASRRRRGGSSQLSSLRRSGDSLALIFRYLHFTTLSAPLKGTSSHGEVAGFRTWE